MTARTKPKTSRPRKRPNSGITIESVADGCFFQFADSGNERPKPASTKHAKPHLNGSAVKKSASVQDRRYLRDIELWLNNCVNFAQRLESKQGAKILQLVTEARERAIRLRG